MPPQIRLAELVALLSLGTDLGLGMPMEHVMRQCLVALRLADKLALGGDDRAVLYYSGLLAWVGCHTDAYEQSKWFGDDLAMKAEFRAGGSPADLMRRLGAGLPLLERMQLAIKFVRSGVRDMGDMLTNHYLATDQLATRLRLGHDVRVSLAQTFERWDGKGLAGRRRDQILLTSRLVNLADVVVLFHRKRGLQGAIDVAKERSGSQLDPKLVELFCRHADEVLQDADGKGTWEAIIAAAPGLAAPVDEATLDHALEAIGRRPVAKLDPVGT